MLLLSLMCPFWVTLRKQPQSNLVSAEIALHGLNRRKEKRRHPYGFGGITTERDGENDGQLEQQQ